MVRVVWMIGSGTLVESRDPFGVLFPKDRLIKFTQPWLILMMASHREPQGGARPIFGRIYFAVFKHHVDKGAEELRVQSFPGIVIRE
jgi:hypothetical protein